MDSILNFVALRRPLEQAPAAATLAADSDLQRAIDETPSNAGREAAARAFATQGNPVLTPDSVPRGADVARLVDLLSDGRDRTAEELAATVGETVGDAVPDGWTESLQRAREARGALGVGGVEGVDADRPARGVAADLVEREEAGVAVESRVLPALGHERRGGLLGAR